MTATTPAIEPGDWVVYRLAQKDRDTVMLVLELRPGNVPGYGTALLRATHLPSGKQYNCTCGLHALHVVRKKDGRKFPLPW